MKHLDLIKAWRNGAKIEYLRDPGLRDQWCIVDVPCWDEMTEYRIYTGVQVGD